jgi:plasmid replication initiation protein
MVLFFAEDPDRVVKIPFSHQEVETAEGDYELYEFEGAPYYEHSNGWNYCASEVRLYELAKSYAYKGQVDISVDALRENLMADVYPAFGNFKQRVLAPAIKEINEYTDIEVTYDCITDKGELVKGRLQGKRITHLRFYIKNKDTLDRFATYNKTVGKIEKRNRQFKGQLSLEFDSNGKLIDIA